MIYDFYIDKNSNNKGEKVLQLKPMYPIAEIIPAISATFLLNRWRKISGKVKSLCFPINLKTRGINIMALSHAPIKPVKSIQLPAIAKPRPPKPIENPPPTSVATTLRPICRLFMPRPPT